jgi:hypothetical protein
LRSGVPLQPNATRASPSASRRLRRKVGIEEAGTTGREK